MLLTLVNAINNNDRPLFKFEDDKKVVPALEENQPSRKRLLNAVTALLVRNHEVVATVLDRSFQHVVGVQQPNNSEQRDKDSEPATATEHDEDSDSATLDSDQDNEVPTSTPKMSARFTVTKNPQHTESYTSTSDYSIANGSTSHKDKFRNWKLLLNIP